MAHQLYRLDSRSTTLLLETELGRSPVWRHFGSRVDDCEQARAWPASALLSLAPGAMDRLSGPLLTPGFDGLAQRPMLAAHRDGRDTVHAWGLVSCTQASPASLELVLADPHAGLRLEVRLHLDVDSDVLSVDAVLHNVGDAPLEVQQWSAPSIPAPHGLDEVGYFSGEWAHEFQWQRERVGAAGWSRDNRRGRTSHQAPAALFVLASQSGDHAGPAVGAQLAWSGNHRLDLQRHEDGRLVLLAGEWFAPGEVILAPGDSLSTPTLHVVFSAAGMSAISRSFHALCRQHVMRWPGGRQRPRPVHINTWEALYFRHELTELYALADHAAGIGVERFVLDDGWFKGRDNDRAALGDWWPDPDKFPQGLAPLIRHVQDLGMEFGLWVEPEMVNPDSDLYRAHPDWALGVAGRERVLGRHQLVLDLSRPEVSAFVFEKLHALLADGGVRYLKWDMNRDLAQACGRDGRSRYHAQVLALYALLERLRTAHPDVEIESCASGGARADLGILRYTHRIWTSDNNDAMSRVAIQQGALRLFPPEVLGCHVGPAPAHATGRTQSLDFRCAVALFGHMGVEADVRRFDEASRDRLAWWLALYKRWRHVVHHGVIDQGQTPSGAIWWLASNAQTHLLCVIMPVPPDTVQASPVRLPTLAASGAWRVRLLARAGQLRQRSGQHSPWIDALEHDGVCLSGDELAHIGLPLPTMQPESALYFSLEHP